MSNLVISVIVCTHNPHAGRLQRVLEALQAQTRPTAEWELLLIDNASQTPIAERFDLSWHPRACCCHEERVGLTWARLRGLEESNGNLLIYVDDDNVLAPDYLESVSHLAAAWPNLGVWGGEIIPDYEEVPASDLEPYTGLLALFEVERDLWCNFRNARCIPRGAGLVVRREVAACYAKRIQDDPLRHMLERQGDSLASCGDSDLCFTAIDSGFGLGVFKQLKLTHIIPKQRVTKEYLLRLEEAMSYSWTILNFLYDGPSATIRRDFLRRCLDFFRTTMLRGVAKDFQQASYRGRKLALAQLKGLCVSKQ